VNSCGCTTLRMSATLGMCTDLRICVELQLRGIPPMPDIWHTDGLFQKPAMLEMRRGDSLEPSPCALKRPLSERLPG
jgi:hypothetical protein